MGHGIDASGRLHPPAGMRHTGRKGVSRIRGL
ncbi:hypothetical protein SUDANB21_06422 [Streptomyces sp. enrichment culture]